MAVGDNIKKRRYELKMSQQELADLMGYKTRSTIAKIESGENDVTQKKLQKFAAVLDTTPAALISGYTADNEGAFLKAESASERQNKNAVIILAGGKSGRNRQNIPSQFINVNGKPILVYCMEVYQNHPLVDDIYVVCLKGWEGIVKAYATQYGITKLRGMVLSGSSGMASLKNGVDYIKQVYKKDDLVIIQEATRPMVSAEMVSHLLQTGKSKGSATVSHLMDDYVQFDVSSGKPRSLNRESIIALQSPEVHRLDIITNVFEKANRLGHRLGESCFTMLMYNLGYDINFIEGNVNNIKITREEDIAAFGALTRE